MFQILAKAGETRQSPTIMSFTDHEPMKGPKISQLELSIEREFQPDRNHHSGGRSFYFFDLDDNVLYLPTPIFIFHSKHNTELALSTGEYSELSPFIGKAGIYRDYKLDFNDRKGSFRRFRDQHDEQPFVEDLALALQREDFTWKGPSWHCFYHAAFNERPLALITARGHHPDTVRAGIKRLVSEGLLPKEPNYLSIFPVSHPETREKLGDSEKTWSIAKLKRAAILASVDEAMREYGLSPHHRFGMSDDNIENVELITEAMRELKLKYPINSFFVIDTFGERYVKQEVFSDRIERTPYPSMVQLPLFNEL